MRSRSIHHICKAIQTPGWKFCPYCGQRVDSSPHRGDPGICQICGAPPRTGYPQSRYCDRHYALIYQSWKLSDAILAQIARARRTGTSWQRIARQLGPPFTTTRIRMYIQRQRRQEFLATVPADRRDWTVMQETEGRRLRPIIGRSADDDAWLFAHYPSTDGESMCIKDRQLVGVGQDGTT